VQNSSKSKGQSGETTTLGEPRLVEFIRDTIRRDGPVPFRWFMEQALYHPEHGYYSSGRAVIGRGGDYFTNVSVGPLFGRLLAAQFEEIWRILGTPRDFAIAEQGAHDGQLVHDVLRAVQQRAPEFFDALTYRIVEPLPVLEQRQRAVLAGFNDKVEWRRTVADLEPLTGVHFSNELLDALPVHLVRWSGSEWSERHVVANADAFEFVDLAVTNSELQKHLDMITMPLPAGYETEVNLAALQWVDEISRKLTHGFVLIVDYGFARDELYASHRTAGTLQCYAKHQVVPSPLASIGDIDITAHVDWTSIAERAESAGLALTGFADQHHFITGFLASKGGAEFVNGTDPKTKRALQTLLHPEFLGMTFQFLALSKGVGHGSRLAGFRFGWDPRVLQNGARADRSS